MKKNIRVLSLILAVSLLLVFGGCQKYRSLDEIKQSGELIMATNAQFPPYEYYEGEEITGFDVALAQAVADKLGVTLKIEDMEFGSVVTSVQSGKADIAVAGLTITEDRQQQVDFSDSYITATQVIIVPEGSDITTSADLDGRKVGVQLSTTGDLYLSYPEDFGIEVAADVQQYNKGSDAILDLLNGKVDAVVIDDQPAKKFVELNEGLTIIDEALTDEQYAIGVAKGSDLLPVINEVIQEMKDDGSFDALLAQYIQ